MRSRIYDPELLDMGPEHYTVEEYRDCIIKLGKMGRYLGGETPTLDILESFPVSPCSILDVGCGAGSLTIRMASLFPKAEVVGCDISKEAIAVARECLNDEQEKREVSLSNISFEHQQNPDLSMAENSFDVVIASLLCHHFEDDQLVDFLKRARHVARRHVLINDLHRNRMAILLLFCIQPVLRNRLIRLDGPLSIRRAFKPEELENFFLSAGFTRQNISISRHWAFRLIALGKC